MTHLPAAKQHVNALSDRLRPEAPVGCSVLRTEPHQGHRLLLGCLVLPEHIEWSDHMRGVEVCLRGRRFDGPSRSFTCWTTLQKSG